MKAYDPLHRALCSLCFEANGYVLKQDSGLICRACYFEFNQCEMVFRCTLSKDADSDTIEEFLSITREEFLKARKARHVRTVRNIKSILEKEERTLEEEADSFIAHLRAEVSKKT